MNKPTVSTRKWKRHLIGLLLISAILLSGCVSESAEDIVSNVDFEYQLPERYCNRVNTTWGIEVYCPEGVMFVEFQPDSGAERDDLFHALGVQGADCHLSP